MVLHTWAGQGVRRNGEKQASETPRLMRSSWETTSALKTLPQASAVHLGMMAALFQGKVDAPNCSYVTRFVNKGAGDGPIRKAKS